ncbi:hypothetical protein [Streptomyces sp. NPDC048425]|uniref:hypothetical protein n=1 Tax=Streptomyces sp. NPDC048425 TaxID=3365548 RepID=UPI00371556E5
MLRSLHPTLIKPLTAGTQVLAVGTWKVFNGGRIPQLVLFADEAWQIAYWHSDEDTGTATQPTSPPALTAHQRATERRTRTSTPPHQGRWPTPRHSHAPHDDTAPCTAQDRAARRADTTGSHGTRLHAAAAATTPGPHSPTVPQIPLAGPARTPPPAPATPSADQEPPPAVPPVPPKPSRPPRPASPPLPPRRRRRAGLADWLGRRKKRRG